MSGLSIGGAYASSLSFDAETYPVGATLGATQKITLTIPLNNPIVTS